MYVCSYVAQHSPIHPPAYARVYAHLNMISFHFSRGTWKSWSRYNTYPKGTSAPTVTLLMRVPACVTSASPLLPGNNMRQAKHEQLNGSKVYIPRLVSQGRRGENIGRLGSLQPASSTVHHHWLLRTATSKKRRNWLFDIEHVAEEATNVACLPSIQHRRLFLGKKCPSRDFLER